ncbi:phosphoribosyl-ATP pyrophosphatase [Frigoriflavimonas asaccharolytica]|uniref:Phosphoribosyl-ATP pyrophosphatase n=1 Tax=Frigoriflavimonas asaccharolytica TaxID=2735899 RepID=A0A8J8K9J8_9FLAO|nr:phosphoribosyl-ATP pyrophosphatase [Frigoriflavimonas asaccharolytica]NRS93137.1 hypothetical protein [Frigoriflavimonas asaccharolytica]
MAKYSSLEELRRKKDLLRKEVSDLENLITFDNKKETLSAITHGFTDKYLKEKRSSDGEQSLSLNTGAIMKEVSSTFTAKASRKDAIMNFTESAISGGAMDDIIKLGVVALIGGYAKKKISDASWKNKIIGAALIYLLPIGLKYARTKLEEYQRKSSISSMGKLI